MTKCEFYKNNKNGFSSLVPFGKVLLLILFLVALPVAEGTLPQQCPVDVPLISDMQNIACATADLRKAVEDDLLKTMGKKNPFASDHHRDVVRSVEPIHIFNLALKEKIEETHHRYQQQGRDNYTLGITSYPAAVKRNSCSTHKTIDARPPSNYSIVEGKEPRYFQVVKHRGKLVICEKTQRSRNQPGLPPACSKMNHSSEDVCVSLNQFTKLSDNLLRKNKAFEKEYCPSDCSYYTQTIQRVYQIELVKKKFGRKKKKKQYCSESYSIVHCGPKKDSSEYNLNIREVKNLCSDFGTCVL